MSNLRQAAEQALEALENVTRHFTRVPSTLKDSEFRGEAHKAMTALRAALEQQQSDPLIEEQRLDIVATALRGHASTRDAIQWAIEAVERHHGIKE